MKTKFKPFIRAGGHSFGVACAVAVLLQFVVLAACAQPGTYTNLGSETTITLDPGTYDITAYGAEGGADTSSGGGSGGLGAEMSAQFNFSGSTTITLLVGEAGGAGLGGGGGGGSFVVAGSTPLVIAAGGGGGGIIPGSVPGQTTITGWGNPNPGYGGGGGTGAGGGGGGFYGDGGGNTATGTGGSSFVNGGASGKGGGGGGNGGYGGGGGGGGTYGGGGGGGGGYSGGQAGGNSGGGGGGSIVGSSALADLVELAGVPSLDGSTNGEIIISQVPEPTTLTLVGLGGLSLRLFRRQRK